MSNSIDKAVVLFVAANFTNQKTGVKYQTGSDGTKKDDAEKNFDVMLPVQDDPAETDSDRDRGQDHAERKKEHFFSATANTHAEILARHTLGRKRTCGRLA